MPSDPALAPVPPIDRAQAERFLSLLGKDPTTARLRAFPHRANPSKATIGPRKGGWDLAAATRWQQEGRGLYLVVNDGGDNDADITACRAFFLEWDDRPVPWQLAAWQTFGLGEPTVAITTGGKSAHLYWALAEPITPAQWAPIQAALIDATGADSTIRNPSRVMRLPGASYVGADGTAQGQTMIWAASGIRYSLAQVQAWLEPDEFAPPTQRPQQQRIDVSGDRLSDLPPRPPEALRDALLRIPPFQHGAGQYQQLLGLAMRLRVDLGADDAQALLAQTCCQAIRDLPSYFRGTPTQISPGSVWSYLAEQWGIDISRHDLKGRRSPPPPDDRHDDATPPGAALSLDDIRQQLEQAVVDGASRQELEALRLQLAAEAELNPAALRDLLRTIEAEQEAQRSIAAEVASIRRAADRRDWSEAITLDWLCPPSLAAALRIRCRSLPADDVAAIAAYLIAVSGVVKLGTHVVASEAASYRVPLNLYGAVVARSGAKKSPFSRLLVSDPTEPLRLDLARQNTRARQDWEEQNRGAKPADRTDRPAALYLSVSDFTAEALAKQLQIQEAAGLGLLINRDEIAGMFGNLNAYRSGRGSDEEQLLEAYDGSGFSSLRVAADGGGRFYDRCHLSVYGTIQPAVLQQLVAGGDASGLWARFLFIPLPERVVPIPESETEQERADAQWAAELLAHLCRWVYVLPRQSLALSAEARRRFVSYEARCQADVHRTTIAAQGALIGKAAGKVLRIAALLHLLHQACSDGWHSDLISDAVIDRACVLVDHLNSWTMGLHEQVADGANDLMRLIHRVAQAAGDAVAYQDVARRMSKAQRQQNDSAAVATAMQALADLGVGEIQRGTRGATRYRSTAELP